VEARALGAALFAFRPHVARSKHASLLQGLECVAVTPAEELLPAAALQAVVHVVELRLAG
jgi:hypothetical protein